MIFALNVAGGVLQYWLSVGMLHGASNVKALTIKGCTSMHPYVPIIIADSTTPPVNLAASSRYDGCTMVQPYIKCTNTYCFIYNSIKAHPNAINLMKSASETP